VKSKCNLNKLLEDFANEHVLATNIKVSISETSKSFQPRYRDADASYENANLLATLVVGAESFLKWLNRKGYEVKSGKSKRS